MPLQQEGDGLLDLLVVSSPAALPAVAGPGVSPAGVVARTHALVQRHHEVGDDDDGEKAEADGDEEFTLRLGKEGLQSLGMVQVGREGVWAAPCLARGTLTKANIPCPITDASHAPILLTTHSLSHH